MKNEKTMLALVLVAALAMVSVAGVALASESDADSVDVSKLTIVYGDLKITSSTSDSYGVYADSGYSKVTINADADYTGTLCFGTYDAAAKIFTPLVTLSLTGVSNAIITYGAGSDDVTIYVNEVGTNVTGVVSGDIVISQGTITLGATSYFTGKIAGNTATIDAVNVTTFTLEAGTTDIISGTASFGAMNKYDTTTEKYVAMGKSTVEISGTAAVELMNLVGVELTIAEGAVVTSANGADYYQIDSGKKFTLTIGNLNLGTASGTALLDAVVLDSNGKIVAAFNKTTMTGGVAEFVVATDKVMSLNDTYTLQVVYVDNTAGKLYAYSGSLSFTVSVVSAAVGATPATYKVTATVTSSMGYQNLSSDALTFANDAKSLTYDDSTYKCLGAYEFSIASGVYTIAQTGNYTTKSGEVSFTNAFATTHTLAIVLQSKTTGAYYVYVGAVTYTAGTPTTFEFAPNSGVNLLTVATGSAAAGKIITNADAVKENDFSTNVSIANQIYSLKLDSNSKLTVDGTLNATYKSLTSNMTITNAGTIIANGHINYESDAVGITNTGKLNAAYYVTSSTTTPKYKYTYTTIATALSESADITIVGEHTILEDLELVSTLSGATSTKVTFDTSAKISVGRIATTTVTAATAIVTVPTSTTMYVNGVISVINGQFRIAGATLDNYGSTTMVADVFYVTSEYGIYTDLATALDAAASGDIITLRQDVKLSKDATVIDGVTLDAKNTYSVTVKSGASLTIVGTAKFATITVEGKSVAVGTTPAKAAGILTINSNNVTFITANIVGVVNMGASDLKLTSGTINIESTDSKNPVIFNITGTVTSNGVLVGSSAVNGTAYVTWNVSGTFNNLVNGTTGATSIYTVMNVTGTYVAMNSQWIAELTVTGNGSVTGKTAADIVVVSGTLIVGTETKDIAANANNATVTVSLSSSAMAYIYGNFDEDKIVIVSETAGTTINSASFIIKSNTYCTIFGTTVPIFAYAPSFTNYTLKGWYSDADLTTKVSATPTGDDLKYYAEVEGKTFTIKATYVANGSWIVNDYKTTSGTFYLTFGEDNTISFTAADGYTWTGKILVNGNEMPANYTIKADDVFTVSAEPVEKEAPAEGMDLVTILLIIITIVIIIMAIIIALKLMRS